MTTEQLDKEVYAIINQHHMIQTPQNFYASPKQATIINKIAANDYQRVLSKESADKKAIKKS